MNFSSNYNVFLINPKEKLSVRVGISTGNGSYGVIGFNRWQYDVTGPVFHEAEMLEPLCTPGGMLINEKLWSRIKNKKDYIYKEVSNCALKKAAGGIEPCTKSER